MSAKVFLVDDDSGFIELMTYRLRRNGFQVFSAAHGLDAVPAICQCQPDVILLDVMLPELDGLSVCEEIQRNSATVRIPVIMVSAFGGPATRAAGLAAGAVDFFCKPVDFTTLPARLNEVIWSRRHLLAGMAKLHTAAIDQG